MAGADRMTPASPSCSGSRSLRGRRHRAVPLRARARRLLGADPADQAVRPELARWPHLKGPSGHAALGRRRGRPAGVATEQPLACALQRHQATPRQVQPGQGRRRSQGPDRRLAHPLAWRAVQAERRARDRSRPGKLLHMSGHLRPTNDLRSRGSCNQTTCASERRKRSQHSTAHEHERRPGASRANPLTARRPSKRRMARRPPLRQRGVDLSGPQEPPRSRANPSPALTRFTGASLEFSPTPGTYATASPARSTPLVPAVECCSARVPALRDAQG